jgi:hypothetical protein
LILSFLLLKHLSLHIVSCKMFVTKVLRHLIAFRINITPSNVPLFLFSLGSMFTQPFVYVLIWVIWCTNCISPIIDHSILSFTTILMPVVLFDIRVIINLIDSFLLVHIHQIGDSLPFGRVLTSTKIMLTLQYSTTLLFLRSKITLFMWWHIIILTIDIFKRAFINDPLGWSDSLSLLMHLSHYSRLSSFFFLYLPLEISWRNIGHHNYWSFLVVERWFWRLVDYSVNDSSLFTKWRRFIHWIILISNNLSGKTKLPLRLLKCSLSGIMIVSHSINISFLKRL